MTAPRILTGTLPNGTEVAVDIFDDGAQLALRDWESGRWGAPIALTEPAQDGAA